MPKCIDILAYILSDNFPYDGMHGCHHANWALAPEQARPNRKEAEIHTHHVAGFYAVIKAAVPGVSIADATAWIVANGVNVLTPVGIFNRINVPPL